MAILNNKQGNITANMPYAEQQLGVDLKLSESGDLEINNLSDFSLIAGMQNLAQAIAVKLSTEPLQNMFHPSIGLTVPIGEKSVDAISIRLDVLRTLRQDPRLDRVDVKVDQDGNTYFLEISVSVNGKDLSIPLQFVTEN